MSSRAIVTGAWSSVLVLPALLVAGSTERDAAALAPGGTEALLVRGDYDGDGLEDAFAILPSGQIGLLHAEANGTLRDVTRAAGLAGVGFAESAAWDDVDGDGALDLVLRTRAGTSVFLNRGGGAFAAATAGGGGVLSGAGAQFVAGAAQSFACPTAIVDQADGVTCTNASSVPTLGMLYPLSEDLFVATTGEVGVGTTAPASRLHVVARGGTPFGENGLTVSAGVGSSQGGVGATVSGGDSTTSAGDGAVVTGGTGRYAGRGAVVQGGTGYGYMNAGGDGAWIAGGNGTAGGAGARISGGDSAGIYSNAGAGIVVNGGDGLYAGVGAEITGGASVNYYGVAGAIVRGGTNPLSGGAGVSAIGGASTTGTGGLGLTANGGFGDVGGTGARVIGGTGSTTGGLGLRVQGGNPGGRALEVDGEVVVLPDFLVVDAAGDVGIGTLTPSERLHVVGNVCATGTIGSCSDARFKTNVAPLADALATVLALRGVSYDWKVEAFPERRFTDERQLGFLAQEANEVVPEIVSKGSDGTYSIDYGKLTPLLVEAVRELRSEHEREVADLRERVERLERVLEDAAGSGTAASAR